MGIFFNEKKEHEEEVERGKKFAEEHPILASLSQVLISPLSTSNKPFEKGVDDELKGKKG